MAKSVDETRTALLALMCELKWTYADVAACVKIQHGQRIGERYTPRAISAFVRKERPDNEYVDIALAILAAFPRIQ